MHAFLSLAQALTLVLGQAEPAETPEPPPPAQEAAPRASEPAAPPREEQRPRRQAAGATPADPAGAAARPQARGEPDRAQFARAALAFLDALIAGDAAALAAASSERFAFDGDVRAGKEEVRRAWRALLADRDPAQHAALLDLEVLPAAEAVKRLGAPPPRLAPLAAARGAWVAIANVSRRPVVLFLAPEGGRVAVTGIQ
jgi:hypothetical protein